MCHLSPFGLLNIAQACVFLLALLDVGGREQDDDPSAHIVASALLVTQLVHPAGDVARIQRCLHTHADGLDDARGGVKNSHHMLGCVADIIAGNRADHRRLFCLIVKMHQEGRIKFSQLIWGGAKGAPLATTEDLSSQRSAACGSNGRWIHISYVPGDLRCQVIGE